MAGKLVFAVMLALFCALFGPQCTVQAGKVLLLPMPQDSSPIYLLRHVYDELKGRGHDAYVSSSGLPCVCILCLRSALGHEFVAIVAC